MNWVLHFSWFAYFASSSSTLLRKGEIDEGLTTGARRETRDHSFPGLLDCQVGVENPHVDTGHGRSRKNQIWVQGFQWHFGILDINSMNTTDGYRFVMICDHVWCCDIRSYRGLRLKTYLHLEGTLWVAPAAQNALSTSFYLYPAIWYLKLIHALSCIAVLPAHQFALLHSWNSFFFFFIFSQYLF